MLLKRKVSHEEMNEIVSKKLTCEENEFLAWCDKHLDPEKFLIKVIFTPILFVYITYVIKKTCNKHNWSVLEYRRRNIESESNTAVDE